MEAYVINLKHRKDRLATFRLNRFPLDMEVETFEAYQNTVPEDGCTQSHLKVLRNHIHLPFAVFEDDCVLIQPWSVVAKAMKQLPDDWDALWLGANPRRPLQQYSENLYRLKDAYCLHAVIYNTQRIVDYIYNKVEWRSGENLDISIAKDVQHKFNCYSVWPMAATQLSDMSDIAKVKTRNMEELMYNYKQKTR
jgi:GR25 family glycosyltransferase involved in LPS biosynthesis